MVYNTWCPKAVWITCTVAHRILLGGS